MPSRARGADDTRRRKVRRWKRQSLPSAVARRMAATRQSIQTTLSGTSSTAWATYARCWRTGLTIAWQARAPGPTGGPGSARCGRRWSRKSIATSAAASRNTKSLVRLHHSSRGAESRGCGTCWTFFTPNPTTFASSSTSSAP